MLRQDMRFSNQHKYRVYTKNTIIKFRGKSNAEACVMGVYERYEGRYSIIISGINTEKIVCTIMIDECSRPTTANGNWFCFSAFSCILFNRCQTTLRSVFTANSAISSLLQMICCCKQHRNSVFLLHIKLRRLVYANPIYRHLRSQPLFIPLSIRPRCTPLQPPHHIHWPSLIEYEWHHKNNSFGVVRRCFVTIKLIRCRANAASLH